MFEISKETREAIEHYDALGLVPAKAVTNLEEHLRQAEKKEKLLKKLEENPQILKEEIGEFEWIYPTTKIEQKFYGRFLTHIRPGVLLNENTSESTGEKRYLKNKTIQRLTQKKGIDGTIYNIGTSINPIQVSIINRWENIKQQETLAHEMVHCIRNSWEGIRSNRLQEETQAYGCLDEEDGIKFLGKIFPTIHKAIETMPLLITGGIIAGAISGWSGLGGIATGYACSLATESIKSYRTQRFFRRAENEGLNPYYLFTHSDPQEFTRYKTITEQLVASNKPRHQIIAIRQGLL